MNVLIVEDEQHNRRLLLGMIKTLRPDWNIMDELVNVRKSVEWLKKNPAPDLIFMDIQLTDGICFSIFNQIEITSMVIFTTAYDKYAIRAFEVNSIDYLLKPLKEEKLKRAIEKLEKIRAVNMQKPDYTELIEALKSDKKKYRKRFLISGTTSYYKVDAADIAFFYFEERATLAVTFDNKSHVIDLTIEKLEEQLEPDIFFRANRGVILNIRSIFKFENYFGGKLKVKLISPFNNIITVSRLKATAFKRWLDG